MVKEISPETPAEGSSASPEALEQRVRELEDALAALEEDSEVAHVLLGLSGVLAEVRSMEDTIDLAVATVCEVFGGARCCALAADESHGGFDVLACTGYTDDSLRSLKELARRPHGLPLMEEALADGVPLFITDAAADARLKAQLEVLDAASFVVLPLVRLGEQFGGVSIEFSE